MIKRRVERPTYPYVVRVTGGLRRAKRTAGTIISARVRVVLNRPDFTMAQYSIPRTSAWIRIDMRDDSMLANFTDGRESRTPGLRVAKRAAGTKIFGDVKSIILSILIHKITEFVERAS